MFGVESSTFIPMLFIHGSTIIDDIAKCLSASRHVRNSAPRPFPNRLVESMVQLFAFALFTESAHFTEIACIKEISFFLDLFLELELGSWYFTTSVVLRYSSGIFE